MKNLISKEEKDQIDLECLRYQIKNYSINSDGSIDVDGNVNLNQRGLLSLPLRFGKVSGSFEINRNKLTTLVGGPICVGGHYECENNNLTTLEGCPEYVGKHFRFAVNYLISTYSGNVDNETVGDLYSDLNLGIHKMPDILEKNNNHIKLILKYQRHFFIWNADLTLNEENFNTLILEIQEGLE